MSIVNEKTDAGQVGDAEAYRVKSDVPSSVGLTVADFDFTPEEQLKIIRRVDYRLVITVGAM